ncbi:MAG: aminotransferase class V-fold PLP-dependent enzyme [Phycisphaerae bacterium]|jgi:cysteine desulfurase family protein|nr:aminotransferase class V-fold PLP-dependent enzyme [Phycisphaerae bacterium]
MNSTDRTIYLDHAATSWPKPDSVRCAALRCYDELLANAGRSGHGASVDCAELVFETREKLAAMFGIPASQDIVFTRGATEGINLVLKGFLNEGDVVAVSPMEHNSVIRPLRALAQSRSVRFEILPADCFGRIDPAAAAVIADDLSPRLVVINHASNVNGIVQDIAAVGALFPEAAMLVDAAQTAGAIPIDVQRDGIDFLAFSAHKSMGGPTGIGACYMNPECDVRPLLEGGTGSRSDDTVHPDFRPDRYEAGTLNLHGIAALSGALEHIESADLIAGLKKELTGVLIGGLSDVDGVHLFSPAEAGALMVAFAIEGISPEVVARRLEEDCGILCRAGLHCAPQAHRHLETYPAGAVRLSPGYGNTVEQMHQTVQAVRTIAASGRQA